MSLRQVLTIYNAERQLSDDESALLNTLRRMSDSDRQMFIDGLAGKASQKKSSKKSAGGGGGRSSSKSPRASGMAAQLNKQLDGRRKEPQIGGFADDTDMLRCSRMIGDEDRLVPCEEPADHNIHHLNTHPGYHLFQPAQQAAATSGD